MSGYLKIDLGTRIKAGPATANAKPTAPPPATANVKPTAAAVKPAPQRVKETPYPSPQRIAEMKAAHRDSLWNKANALIWEQFNVRT